MILSRNISGPLLAAVAKTSKENNMKNDNNLYLRINNALLLAQAKGLDITKSEDLGKLLRHLSLVEERVANYLGDADA